MPDPDPQLISVRNGKPLRAGGSPNRPLLAASSSQYVRLDDDDSNGAASFKRAKWSLIAGYALAAWAWRSWEFAVALLLIKLYPRSLFMVSVYGLADNAVRITGGASVGGYISRTALFTAARAAVLWQNACIGASAASAAVLLMYSSSVNAETHRELYWGLMGVMVGLGALSSIGSTGVRIAVENKAVAQLCNGDSRALSTTNASFRAIDLSALLAAPLPVGVGMTVFGPLAATAILAAYTLCAWLPELLLLHTAFSSSPALRVAKVHTDAAAGAGAAPSTHPRSRSCCNPRRALHHYVENWGVYLKQTVLLPNLALALLYCTVLSLGFLMTSYMSWSGLTEAEISVFRGFGAVTGLSATALFPYLARKLGVVHTGLTGALVQWGCLVTGASPLLHQVFVLGARQASGEEGPWRPSALSVRCLVGGVVASRTGLWLYDLSVTQLVQEQVAADELGMVCGVQSSLQATFETLSFLAALYFSDPSVFYWLVLGSIGFVTSAALLYTLWVLSSGASSHEPQQHLQHQQAGQAQGAAGGGFESEPLLAQEPSQGSVGLLRSESSVHSVQLQLSPRQSRDSTGSRRQSDEGGTGSGV